MALGGGEGVIEHVFERNSACCVDRRTNCLASNVFSVNIFQNTKTQSPTPAAGRNTSPEWKQIRECGKKNLCVTIALREQDYIWRDNISEIKYRHIFL